MTVIRSLHCLLKDISLAAEEEEEKEELETNGHEACYMSEFANNIPSSYNSYMQNFSPF